MEDQPKSAPKVWVSASVCIGKQTFSNTAENLAKIAESVTPGASKRVCPLGGSGLEPHVTVLYHGHPKSEAFVEQCKKHIVPDKTFSGRVRDLYVVRDHKASVFCLVLDIDCEELQDFYATFRGAVEAATGETSKQRPHVGPNGEHLVKNDYRPHITIAHWETEQSMDKDLFDAMSVFGHFINQQVFIGGIRVHGV